MGSLSATIGGSIRDKLCAGVRDVLRLAASIHRDRYCLTASAKTGAFPAEWPRFGVGEIGRSNGLCLLFPGCKTRSAPPRHGGLNKVKPDLASRAVFFTRLGEMRDRSSRTSNTAQRLNLGSRHTLEHRYLERRPLLLIREGA